MSSGRLLITALLFIIPIIGATSIRSRRAVTSQDPGQGSEQIPPGNPALERNITFSFDASNTSVGRVPTEAPVDVEAEEAPEVEEQNLNVTTTEPQLPEVTEAEEPPEMDGDEFEDWYPYNPPSLPARRSWWEDLWYYYYH